MMANPLLDEVRNRLRELTTGDEALHWALRRKLYKELTYDERSKPMKRKALKGRKRTQQHGACAICKEALSEKDVVLDRFEAQFGYTMDNTQLICRPCDTVKQQRLRFSDGVPE